MNDKLVALPNANLARPVSLDPVTVYIAGFPSAKSRDTMAYAFQRMATIMGGPVESVRWEKLDFARTNAIRAELIARYSPKTVVMTLTALRGVLKTCWRLELISQEAYARAIDWPRYSPPFRPPAGRSLTAGEVKALMAYCNGVKGALGAQLTAIMALMLSTGLRISEVAALPLAGYAFGSRAIRVKGKGGKVIDVPLGKAAGYLDTWYLIRSEQGGEWLFARSKGRPFNNRFLERLIAATARRAGIKEHVRPHDLRRTFCTRMLGAGVDLATVSRLMRHESVDTTRLYDRREAEVDAAAHAAVNLLEE